MTKDAGRSLLAHSFISLSSFLSQFSFFRIRKVRNVFKTFLRKFNGPGLGCIDVTSFKYSNVLEMLR